MRRRGMRHGPLRAAVAACVALVAILAVACGGSGRGAETDGEKAADVEVLNSALAAELTAVAAYTRGLPLLRGPLRAVGRELLAQEREDVDALTKAIRGLGGETDAQEGELDFSGVKSGGDFLRLVYELESAALASYLDAAPRLFNAAPRSLAASLAAGHAQHLVVLRQGLGVDLAAAAPEAFDSGEIPPPGRAGQPSGAG